MSESYESLSHLSGEEFRVNCEQTVIGGQRVDGSDGYYDHKKGFVFITQSNVLGTTDCQRSDDQRNEETIGDQEVVIKSEDNHNNGSSDEEMCGTSQDIHSTEGLFMCLLNGCQNTFELKQNYTRHQLVVHPDAFPHKPWIQCSHTGCQFRTKHTGTMTQHSHKHTKPFVCTRCGQTFTTNIALRLHSMRHNCHPISQTNERTVESQDVTTNEESNADPEVVLKSGGHRDNGSNDTKMCDKPKVIQTTDGLFACSLNGCQNTFEFKQNLSRHHLVVHPDAFPDIPWIECQYTGCEYRTKHNHTMRQHEYKHTKPFKCSRCGQTFKSNRALEVHSKKQHNKQLVRVRTRGSGCGNTSVNKSRLKSQTNRQTVGTQVMNTNADQEVVIKSEDVLFSSLNPTRSDDQRNEELIGDQEVVIKSEDNHNNGSSDEEMCETSQDIHSTEGLFVCSLNGCEFSCRRKSDFNRHQLVVHPDAFPHKPWLKCPQKGCQYRTKHKGTLTQHSYRHTTPFKCTQCGQTFPTNIALRHHFQRNHNKELVKVLTRRSTCGKSTVNKSRPKPQTNEPTVGSQDVNTTEKSINSNEVKIVSIVRQSDSRLQTSEGLHVCGYNGCGKSYPTLRQLSQHKRMHPKVNQMTTDGRYVCGHSGCGKSFAKLVYLTKHKYTHNSDKIYRCDVDGCSARFSSPIYVNSHKMNKHNTKYRCDWEGCDYKTGSKYIFDKHQLIAHSGERQFTCPVEECLQTFKTKSDATHHQLRRHPDSVPDVPWIHCTHTDCQYKNKSDCAMKAHLKQHTKHYRCDECSKWFTHLSQLKLHEPIHNEALQYPCEWPGCERRFPRKGHLALHMAAHEGEKKYRCSWPGCSKKYNVNHVLKMHEITHKDPTKYRCHWPGCGRLLSSKKSLTRHESEHTASRRYRCHWPGCEYNTHDTKSLNNHLNRSHK
ncbi:unnamed protein product [Oppiella nova]|uniref:C2H2-type domain-containing protein n=1 Tax=Oppiella nova TaxID=334625 RepID=A0A7R9LYA7_9ACAR|nr:unnamed protein product [Oppiella nova]CAG2168092.1 unnamed protein product [Oppiella nova]